jgi:hypothetical protein
MRRPSTGQGASRRIPAFPSAPRVAISGANRLFVPFARGRNDIMSWIGNTPRPPAELAQLGLGAEMQGGGYAAPTGSGIAPPWANSGDAILGFGAMPAQASNAFSSSSPGLGGSMTGFFGLIGNMFAQIQQYLAQALGSGVASAPASGYGPVGSQPPNAAQTFYGSADASSVGDPHEAFNGTNGSGNTVGGKWDSMRSHRDLLSSDSFNGGYRVSTQATQPNASGTTLNQSGTVTTASGNTTVSLNANGQYAVTSYGQNITLQQGQSTDLGNGENVTLNADNSLTVNDGNAQGGASRRRSPRTAPAGSTSRPMQIRSTWAGT